MIQIHRHHTQLIRCFASDAADAGPLAQHYAGIQTIPLAAIVGSVCRAQNLRSDFRPIHDRDCETRYRYVVAAMQSDTPLPAIEVYQLADRYYVLDGHHRVACARALGQLSIDAIVIEYRSVSGMTMPVAA
jgi:hypothetical protein